MAKNKLKNIDSFYKKKARLDVDGAAVENNSVVDCPDLVEEEGAEQEEGDEQEDEGDEQEEEGDEQEEEGQQEDVEEQQEDVEEENPPQIQRVNDGSGVLIVERDPGKRCPIWNHDVNVQDQARKAYVKHGPYQFHKKVYPASTSSSISHPRRFQYHWFKAFPWLEYSPTKDAAFCLPCFLFCKKPLGKVGSDVFTVKGFQRWRKVNNGKKCAFLTHIGKTCNSAHNYAVRCYDNLKNQPCHIEQLVEKQSEEEIKGNRLRLRTTIDVLRWLAFQACSFRGHDESKASKNQGNFLEMVKLIASYDEEVGAVVLGNAPQNAKYTSPTIQKELLHIMAC